MKTSPRLLSMLSIFTVLAVVSLTSLAIAADGNGGKKAGIRGHVQSVDGTKITIKNKSGEQVIDTDDNTKFTLDGKDATLADVKEGERAMITPDTGTATEVKLMSPKARKHRGDATTEPATEPATPAPTEAK